MSKARDELTVERLRELLDYDPEAGVLWWRVDRRKVRAGSAAGVAVPDGYTLVTIDYHLYPAHRLAWLWMTGKWPNLFIDHINRDKSDNRWDNLREATNRQNQGNTVAHRDNRLGVKGVTFDSVRRKYRASIKIGGKSRNLGRYDTLEAAAAAYAKAAAHVFGEFAVAANDNNKPSAEDAA